MERFGKLIPFGIAALLLTMAACSKPDPPALVLADPSFDLQVQMDGQSMDFTPGADNLYLFTEVFENHSGGVEFESTVHPLDAPFPSLTFRMIVAQESLFASEDVLNEITMNDHVLELEDELDYALHLEMPEDAGYVWAVNGEEFDETDVTVSVEEEFAEIQLFGNSPACDNMMMLEVGGIVNCLDQPAIGMVNVEVTEDDQLIITPPSYFDEYNEIIWDVNGMNYFTTGNESFVVEVNGVFGLTIFALGQTDFFLEPLLIQNVLIQNPDCPFPDFTIESSVDHPLLVEVKYIDENGIEYTSNLSCFGGPQQTPEAFLEFTTVEDFMQNENGLPTKKVSFNANLELFPIPGDPGQPIVLNVENGSFAFAFVD